MKIVIDSSCDKELKYKIFEVNGKKRKAVCKGRFIREMKSEVQTFSDEIILRITRKVSFLSALYVWAVNVFMFETLRHGICYGPKLNRIWEIRISNVQRQEIIQVKYNNVKPEISTYSDKDKKFSEPDVLYCISHSFKREMSWIKKLDWLSFIFYFLSLVVIIAIVFFLIFFLCRDLLLNHG